MADEVKLKVENQVGQIIINRPDQKNSLNINVLTLLREAFLKLESDNDVKVILFSGEGDQAFCSGADLKELAALNQLEERREFFSRIGKLIALMQSLSKPIIAKVHGYALAGGCGLAAAADIVLASDQATFGVPEIKIGLVPLTIMAPIYRAIGRRALFDLVLSGENITAERALEIDLVSRIYKKEELDAQALKLAGEIANYSALALATGKQALYQICEFSDHQALKEFPDRIAVLSLGAEAQPKLEAFAKKSGAKK